MQAFDIDPNLYLTLYADYKLELFRIFNRLNEGYKNRRIFNRNVATTRPVRLERVVTGIGDPDLTTSQRLAGVNPSPHLTLRYPEPLVF